MLNTDVASVCTAELVISSARNILDLHKDLNHSLTALRHFQKCLYYLFYARNSLSVYFGTNFEPEICATEIRYLSNFSVI